MLATFYMAGLVGACVFSLSWVGTIGVTGVSAVVWDLVGGVVWVVVWSRNFLFLMVTLPEPSILTLYRFCTRSTLEIFRPWSTLVCSVGLSSCFTCLLVVASSLMSLMRGRGVYMLGLIERDSLIG